MRHFLYCLPLLFLGLLTCQTPPPAQAAVKLPVGLQEKVNAAVDKGVEWLKAQQMTNGSWKPGQNPAYGGGQADTENLRFGVTALCTLALLESDVPTKDPVIVKAIDYLATNSGKADTSYSAATLMMVIHAYARHQMIESLPEKSTPEQKAKAMEKARIVPPKNLDKAAKDALKKIIELQRKEGGWRYAANTKPFPDSDKSDSSSTQFALLGLHSAELLGMDVKPDIYVKAVQFVLSQQEQDGPLVQRVNEEAARDEEEAREEGDKKKKGGGGTAESKYVPAAKDRARGWQYVLNAKEEKERLITGGMTTVGICSLILAKSHILEQKWYVQNKENYNQSIFDGFGWLTENWTVSKNPNGVRSHYYYLYGLERVGVLGGFDYIGGNNWYREGAEWLVNAQKEEGWWKDNNEVEPKDLIATSLALLFLKRGTASQAVTSGMPER